MGYASMPEIYQMLRRYSCAFVVINMNIRHIGAIYVSVYCYDRNAICVKDIHVLLITSETDE
jgi:hypothetical protein